MKHKLTRNKKSFRKTLKKHNKSKLGKKSRLSKKSKTSKKNRLSKKYKKHNGHKRTRRYRKKVAQKGGNDNPGFGGANSALNNPSPVGGDPTNTINNLQEAGKQQNNANKLMAGGSGSGIDCGIPCCNSDPDYGYDCPPGKCGPIPQTGSEASDNLITQAAKITASGISNAEFDSLVSDKYLSD
jgi:hypothetical protein